jgi:hypothetical protein
MNFIELVILFIIVGVFGFVGFVGFGFMNSISLGPHRYIDSDRGLIGTTAGRCTSRMLVSHDGVNILDENLRPITCNGYVELTKEEIKIMETDNGN